eukprot:5998794-Karenia_brevis.AAC.1
MERHHELLRQLLHRVMTQLKEEKIRIPLDPVVAESLIVKNMLVSVSGASPYQALYGRVSPLP